jgi:hypothetical protein
MQQHGPFKVSSDISEVIWRKELIIIKPSIQNSRDKEKLFQTCLLEMDIENN